MRRITLAGLLASIAAIAVGLAAMRDGSELAASAAYTLALAAVAVGLLGALVRRGDPGWTGFALFGGTYALAAFVPAFRGEIHPKLLSTAPMEALAERLHDVPPLPPPLPFAPVEAGNRGVIGKETADGTVLLTPEEAALLRDIEARERVHWAVLNRKGEAIRYAGTVGDALLTLVLGLIGAALGRLLAGRRAPAPSHSIP